MNRRISCLAACLAALFPVAATAQQRVQQAFDRLLQSDITITKESHSTDKDPQTGQLNRSNHSYSFHLAEEQRPLLDEIRKAFADDRPNAYNENTDLGSGGMIVRGGEETNNYVSLHYGNHICMYFLEPGDTAQSNRCMYALEWEDSYEGLAEPVKSGADCKITIRRGRLSTTLFQNSAYAQGMGPDLFTSESFMAADVMRWMGKYKGLDETAWLKRFDENVSKLSDPKMREYPHFPLMIMLLSKESQNVSPEKRKEAIQKLEKIKNSTQNVALKRLYVNAITYLDRQ